MLRTQEEEILDSEGLSRRGLAILQDLCGPKIRTGRFRGGKPVKLITGARITLTESSVDIESLIGKGRQVRIHDPHIRLEEIYGANKKFVLEAIPHIGRLLAPGAEEVIDWSDLVVIATEPGAAVREYLTRSGKQMLDLTAGAV